MALQSSDAAHLGVDNLGVVRHVGRLLDGHRGSTPIELVTDGDLLLLIERVLRLRGLDTVRITKVKGRADEGMVLEGRVGEQDRWGNNAADEAADFGRRRVGGAVIDARRDLSGVCGRWYLVILDLHRFFLAISRAVVNRDGSDGTAPDPLVLVRWCSCQEASVSSCPLAICFSEWIIIPAPAFSAEDVAQWPTLLVSWLNGLLSWAPFIVLLVAWILKLVAFLMLSCSFFMSFGLVERLAFERSSSSLSSSRAPNFSVGCSIWSRH